jgi:peptidoglycan/xylan/chitin deacetylase (PgdA/CDA1 family)
VRRWVWALVVCAACTQKRPEVPILNYHSVGQVADDYTVPAAAFARQLDALAAGGYRTVSLHDLLRAREGGPALPRPAVVLTFDDGKEDALRLVLPALQKRGMRATFFIITSLVGQPGYLTWDEVRALAAEGMEIGSHTIHHPRLADLSDEQVRQELEGSRRELEAQLRRPVEALAYPYNSVRARVVRSAAESGYRVAVAGAVHGSADLLELYRFPVSGLTSDGDFRRAAASQ